MTNLTHSTGHGTGYGNQTLLENPRFCTLETCDLTLSSFLYRPTVAGNAIFAAVFALYLVGQIGLGIKYKTWGYMGAMILGLLLEVIGYVGRVMIHNAPFNNDNFLMYLVTLTIAPALLTAAVYLCLARIVIVYGENLSRFKPRTYTLVFCTCDIISLVLQALGGGIASTSHTVSGSDLGKNIMLAGLGFQVFSLILFSVCCGEFAFRVWRQQGAWNTRYSHIVHSLLFKAFLTGLLLSVVTIFIRSVYRCVELSGGFNGSLFISHEAEFMILEGLMIVIACSCLTLLHPAICFQGAWHEANFKFRTSKNRSTGKVGSDEESQVEMKGFQRVSGQTTHNSS